MYLPDTNILLTRFFSQEGLAELVDFMPVESDRQHTWNHRLVAGSLRSKVHCAFGWSASPLLTMVGTITGWNPIRKR